MVELGGESGGWTSGEVNEVAPPLQDAVGEVLEAVVELGGESGFTPGEVREVP